MKSALAPFGTPGDALAFQARHSEKRECMVFGSERLTYGEWYLRSNAFARGLLNQGLKPGDHIGLLAESRMEWPVVQIAVAMMGGVLIPLNTHYGRDDLRYALRQSRTKALVTSTAFRNNRYLEIVHGLRRELPDLELLVTLEEGHPDCLHYDELMQEGLESKAALPAVDPDSVASLQYTSGTTGFPKGALLTHTGMMANAWGISSRLRVEAGDRWTSIIPLFHCAGCIMCVLGTLQRGACYIGVPAFDPEEMFSVIEREACTMLSGVPTSWLAMLEHPGREGRDLSTLRAGTCGGADTDPDLLRRCAQAFPVPGLVQVYGQTESSTLVSLADCEAPERFETCGPPLPGARVRITDPRTGKELPQGELGQIETAGPMVMKGYYERPEATRETIADDGWMQTGDLGYLTSDGNVVVAGGRLRDMIIRGGENIYPVEIENLLRTHPAVSDIAVFGVPDRYYGEIVAAAVQLQDKTSVRDLQQFCEGRIARFKIPSCVYCVDNFPLTASGKVRKTELQLQERSGTLRRLA